MLRSFLQDLAVWCGVLYLGSRKELQVPGIRLVCTVS